MQANRLRADASRHLHSPANVAHRQNGRLGRHVVEIALPRVAQLLRTVIGSPCIEGNLADADPDTSGIQYDCSVSDVRNYGKANQTEEILKQCNNQNDPDASTNKPCSGRSPRCSAARRRR